MARIPLPRWSAARGSLHRWRSRARELRPNPESSRNPWNPGIGSFAERCLGNGRGGEGGLTHSTTKDSTVHPEGDLGVHSGVYSRDASGR